MIFDEVEIEDSEIFSVVSSLFRVGTVENVKGSRVEVRISEQFKTIYIPVLAASASKKKAQINLEKGDKVLIVCLNGDPNQGYVLGSIHIGNNANDSDYIEWKDGTRVSYDEKNKTLDVSVVENGKINLKINKGGSISANGNEAIFKFEKIKFDGACETTSPFKAPDFEAGGIKFLKHNHISAKPGDPTGPSQGG